jgi:sporulation-control protein spo0M
MSLLANLGAAFGHGGATVSAAISEGVFRWNESISATVTVLGGEHAENGCEVIAYVREHWITKDDEGDTTHHYRRYNSETLATNVAVEPGRSYSWACTLTVPDGASLTHDWAVMGRLGVPRAVDREGMASFTLVPPRPIQGLENAICADGAFTPRSRTSSKQQVILDYIPPDGMKRSLDGVKLLVQVEGDLVTGVLEINPQERTFGDHLKSLVHADRVKYPIQFPAAPLAASLNGRPLPDVVAHLRELILKHVD